MKFFISYSRSVQDTARDIVESLRDINADVWWDQDLRAGQDAWALILDRIESCNIFLFIVSQKSVESPTCMAELRYALARNRLVLPYIVDTPNYPIPAEISRIHYEQYTNAAQFISRLRVTCRDINWSQYRDRYAPRPSEPNADAEDLIDQLDRALLKAHEGHFDEAIHGFDVVLRYAYDEYGAFCNGWIEKIHLYREIAKLTNRPGMKALAQPKWERFVGEYGTDFDPLSVAAKLAAKDPNETQPTRPSSLMQSSSSPNAPYAPPARPAATFDIYEVIQQFNAACDAQDWEKAAAILQDIRESGMRIPRVFNLEAYEQEVQAQLQNVERNKDYDLIRRMLRRKDPNYRLIHEALQDFWSRFPNYDPDGLGESRELYARIWFASACEQDENNHAGRVDALNEAINLKPDFYEAYVARANAYHALKLYAQAVVDFTQAILIAPRSVEAYYGRGYSQAAQGADDLALADFVMVQRLAPEYRAAPVASLIETMKERSRGVGRGG
jgi:tetratricopeptide (TPR) repeat protein